MLQLACLERLYRGNWLVPQGKGLFSFGSASEWLPHAIGHHLFEEFLVDLMCNSGLRSFLMSEPLDVSTDSHLLKSYRGDPEGKQLSVGRQN